MLPTLIIAYISGKVDTRGCIVYRYSTSRNRFAFSRNNRGSYSEISEANSILNIIGKPRVTTLGKFEYQHDLITINNIGGKQFKMLLDSNTLFILDAKAISYIVTSDEINDLRLAMSFPGALAVLTVKEVPSGWFSEYLPDGSYRVSNSSQMYFTITPRGDLLLPTYTFPVESDDFKVLSYLVNRMK